MTITDAELVWDNGQATPWKLPTDEKVKFKAKTGAHHVVGFRWRSEDEVHEATGFVEVLPDLSGFVVGGANNGKPDELVVVNADGSVRFRLQSPVVVPGSPSLQGRVHLELPRAGWPAGSIAFGPIACFESRRSFPVMLDLDWVTGAVRGAEQLPRFF